MEDDAPEPYLRFSLSAFCSMLRLYLCMVYMGCSLLRFKCTLTQCQDFIQSIKLIINYVLLMQYKKEKGDSQHLTTASLKKTQRGVLSSVAACDDFQLLIIVGSIMRLIFINR